MVSAVGKSGEQKEWVHRGEQKQKRNRKWGAVKSFPPPQRKRRIEAYPSVPEPLTVCSLLLPHSLSSSVSLAPQPCCGVWKPLPPLLSARSHTTSLCLLAQRRTNRIARNNVELRFAASVRLVRTRLFEVNAAYTHTHRSLDSPNLFQWINFFQH